MVKKEGFILKYIALIAFMLLYGLASFFMGYRGYKLAFNNNIKIHLSVYAIITIFLASSFILSEILKGKIYPSVQKCFYMVGSYYLAVLFYFLLFSVLTAVIGLMIKFVPETALQNRILNLWGMIVIISLLSIVSYGTFEASHPKIKNYNVSVENNIENYCSKIVMVSDIHIGGGIHRETISSMVKNINNENPDLVLFVGDIIDDDVSEFDQKYIDEIKKIKAKQGVYGTLGNHEYISGNPKEAIEKYEKAGIKILKDQKEYIGNNIVLVGRDDASGNRMGGAKRADLKELIDENDKKKTIILLDHQPIDIKNAEKENVSIMFSGHTHDGQFFPNNIITKAIFDISYGKKDFGKLSVIVSSGYGTWGPPIRIGSKSEIVVVKLKEGK